MQRIQQGEIKFMTEFKCSLVISQNILEFYSNAIILKYELPMMIISNTKDIFLKRLKRMKKMIASDCSSQQSSPQNSERSSQMQSFSSEVFIRTIRTEELQMSEDENSLIKNCKRNERVYDEQVHDIFADNNLDLTHTFHQPQIKPLHIEISPRKKGFQIGLSHLIIDIDDINKEKALKQYKKLQQRQNLHNDQIYSKKGKDGNPKKSSIIITALDHYPGDKQSQSSGVMYNYYPKNSKNPKKMNPSSNRYREQVYDQTIRLNNYNYNSNYVVSGGERARNMRPIPAYRSPSFGMMEMSNETERNFIYSPNPDSRRIPTRQRINTHNLNTHSYPYPHLHPQEHYYQNLNQITSEQNQTVYLAQENSVSQVPEKVNKKQYIKQKAAALLHKVKSEQKFPLFQEQIPKRLSKYQTRGHGYQ